jgi:hypothetical protein
MYDSFHIQKIHKSLGHQRHAIVTLGIANQSHIATFNFLNLGVVSILVLKRLTIGCIVHNNPGPYLVKLDAAM